MWRLEDPESDGARCVRAAFGRECAFALSVVVDDKKILKR